MKINIREAKREDMKAVLELIQELAVFEKEPDAVIITEANLIKDGFEENPAFKCFVAEADGNIEGMALVYERYSTWKGRTVHLEDLIVRDKFRGKGLGSALYTRVIKYGHEKGVKRVEWVVLDWNTGAIDFYNRSGAMVLQDWNTVHMNEEGIKNYLIQKGSL